MNQEVFEQLHADMARPLWLYVKRVTGGGTENSSAVADDIIQESFFRLLRASPATNNIEELKAYFYRTVTNLIKDYFRQLKRENLWTIDEAETEQSSNKELFVYETTMELNFDVVEAFQQLKPNERALLWLAFVEGYSHRIIAEILNVKEKSVRVLLFRARQRFAEILKPAPHQAND